MHFEYKTSNTCSQIISFDLDGDIIHNISFVGGCNGNLKAISKLVDGMTVSEVEKKLLGNTCGNNTTSCADQLARAVMQAYNSRK